MRWANLHPSCPIVSDLCSSDILSAAVNLPFEDISFERACIISDLVLFLLLSMFWGCFHTLFYLFLFFVYGNFAYMYVCTPHVCFMPIEAGKGL